MEKTNIMVEFCILGAEFNFEEVTKTLLLEPTECYKKGSKSIRNIERKETCWSLSTGYRETLYLSEVLDDLINQLIGVKDRILKLKKDLNLVCKFFIVINIVKNSTPAIYLDKRAVEFANSLGAEFDFDVYIL